MKNVKRCCKIHTFYRLIRMLDEEVVNKEARHGNERLLIVNAVSMFAIPAVFSGERRIL